MRKIFILALIIATQNALSQSAEEEALILNQELQFLEDSVHAKPLSTTTAQTNTNQPTLKAENLERTYFGSSDEDSIQTRTSAPKRRKN